jgi:ubiquinone/menaquinone biosynthesis C-methylase UbiE
MFTKSANYYDAIYHFKDYTAASQLLHECIVEHAPNAKTLLDVACGTAKHLEALQKFYHVEGLDINSELLKTARQRCPEVTFHEGNMITFRLDRKYDVVACLFSSIAYVKVVENLYKTVATMAYHLSPGGLLFIEPWFSPETYWVRNITANHVNQPELKITWMYTSERQGHLAILDINYLVGTPDGVDYFKERHELGLFTHEEYLEAFRDAGLEVVYDSKGLFGRGMYTGVKKKPNALGCSAT